MPGATVHPHGRGEHIAQRGCVCIYCGSSPRSWGTQSDQRCIWTNRRFIPTVVGNTLYYRRFLHLATVHPHGRGEHGYGVGTLINKAGSSPRSWGTLSLSAIQPPPNRFIPTVVGNTKNGTDDEMDNAVHPHGRGEHHERLGYALLGLGSSPRSWGTRGQCKSNLRFARFIPTVVGNTGNTQTRLPRLAVHPHGRGEHQFRRLLNIRSGGSSPRSWGTH